MDGWNFSSYFTTTFLTYGDTIFAIPNGRDVRERRFGVLDTTSLSPTRPQPIVTCFRVTRSRSRFDSTFANRLLALQLANIA